MIVGIERWRSMLKLVEGCKFVRIHIKEHVK